MNARPAIALNAEPAAVSTSTHFRACLLLGALGDALGAPLEYLRIEEIRTAFGPHGLREPTRFNGRVGSISDDTQMLLFTAEGLLAAADAAPALGVAPFESQVGAAYHRWLVSQGLAAWDNAEPRRAGLIDHAELRVQRAPSLTCLDALEAAQVTGERATNTRKGNVAASRTAPVGLLFAAMGTEGALGDGGAACYALAGRLAAMTHGHPSACHAAGAFATLIAALLCDRPWDDALAIVDALLVQHDDAIEVRQSIGRALDAPRHQPGRGLPIGLGEGWEAPETLAIAIHLARDASDPVDALLSAVNHSGDSDGCGMMTGCLLGAARGTAGIPSDWLTGLEMAGVTAEHAERLLTAGRRLVRATSLVAAAAGA